MSHFWGPSHCPTPIILCPMWTVKPAWPSYQTYKLFIPFIIYILLLLPTLSNLHLSTQVTVYDDSKLIGLYCIVFFINPFCGSASNLLELGRSILLFCGGITRRIVEEWMVRFWNEEPYVRQVTEIFLMSQHGG